jgi:hypothetical protein
LAYFHPLIAGRNKTQDGSQRGQDLYRLDDITQRHLGNTE